MELWIRSQDRECLIKAKIIKWEDSCLRGATDDDGWYYDLGKYKKERALEVLDEIQEKLKNKFLCKPNCLMTRQDADKEENILNIKYDESFIMQPRMIDIEPINCDIVVYEMPKE